MEFEKAAITIGILGITVQLVIYGAIGYAGYKILQYFGIV